MGEIILLGLIIGIIFYELTDISPGGLIVPGVIAYYVYQPERILMTVIVALITYVVVFFVEKRTILFGKRKFVVHILVATIISFIISLFGQKLQLDFLLIPIIGYLIPGIISNEMNKQGILKTLLALVVVSSFVYLVGLLI